MTISWACSSFSFLRPRSRSQCPSFEKHVIALAPSLMDRFCSNFTQMFSMKNILIKFKIQLSTAKVNVKVAILRNALLAVRFFHLWTDFDIPFYKF